MVVSKWNRLSQFMKQSLYDEEKNIPLLDETNAAICVQNDRDSADYVLGTTAQSEVEKVAK